MTMEKGAKGSGRSLELGTLILEKVEEVASAVAAAKHVDEVILALYNFAVRIFPVDSSAICDAIDPTCRSKLCKITLPIHAEMGEWREAFYNGAAFPAITRILIHDVANKWLACFSGSIKKIVYDSFFVQGPSTEIVQVLVPALTSGYDNAFYLNVERLLIQCLIKREGMRHLVGEFRRQGPDAEHDNALKSDMFAVISKVAQLLTSIPDKTRLQTSSVLSSHLFFQQTVTQLLNGVEDCDAEISNKSDDSDANILDWSLLFVGETFSRICRRGSADVLLAKLVPRVLGHVGNCLSSSTGSITSSIIKSNPKSQFWLFIIESMKDQYAIERLTEDLLRHLAARNISDVEAYWILWLLYHRIIKQKPTMRSMFVDKFLFWKVFPICCLRWILQLSVFECPPNSFSLASSQKTLSFRDVVDRLVSLWSRREFVQSSSMEQQAYITAAVGLCIERMSREDLEATKDALHSILQGVSCRLESPIDLVRKMASAVALVFSKAVDPEKPLYLDGDCSENIDWEFGFISGQKDVVVNDETKWDGSKPYLLEERKRAIHAKSQKDGKYHAINGGDHKASPEVVDQQLTAEEDDEEGKNSDASSDSLEPYDLSDDYTDLKKFSQLGDLAAALRKPDDPDGVVGALDIAEKLVRASPDELPHHSGELIRALVYVRCSDVAVDGEEDSAEAKRQKALVALLVTCPFESVDALTKLLYSQNVDVAQRILMLDVMIEAAQELSQSTVLRTKQQHRSLISSVSGQPWFVPSSRGPTGAGPWKQVSDPGNSIDWSSRYEREVPSRPNQIKPGKSRKWGLVKAKDPLLESSRNRFPLYAAAFMLPVMQGFDKGRRVDLLNRDFIVLGQVIYMLGVCMKCITMHPEASVLAPALLDMIRTRELSHHAEAYVRRSVLFAASCILVALHPAHVASALIEGNQEISNGLEWIRTWAHHIAESDPDTECTTMAMTCLQLHAEMALQTSRALESAESFASRTNKLPNKLDNIIIPFSNMR